MENGPVTGALASLLMATAGDVVSASTQLSCAPPPASDDLGREPLRPLRPITCAASGPGSRGGGRARSAKAAASSPTRWPSSASASTP